MTKLPAVYTAAQRALAKAATVEEAASVKNIAEGMEVLAIKARDPTLAADAARIKLAATRKLGVMLKAEKQAGRLAKSGPKKVRVIQKPELLALAARGVDKNLAHRARTLEAMPDSKFEKHVSKMVGVAVAAAEGNREVVLAAKAERHAQSLAKRVAREKAVAGKIMALPKKRFGVVLADCEWQFDTYSDKGKIERSAENHYTTSDLETLKARDIESIAADDCVLFLWATSPMLPAALQVMAAWGFEYKSHLIWAKDRVGTGYWFRNMHELLLLGTRGNVPAPAAGTQWCSVLEAPRGEHSAKPEIFYRVIEDYFPNVPKIELNARKAREGWESWGFEAPEAA